MTTSAREVYVISDLHIGGEYPMVDAPGGRGFRLCTHVEDLAAFVHAIAAKPRTPGIELVINGDFVDFLAERQMTPPLFTPFLGDQVAAATRFRNIVARDRMLFEALATLLAKKHDLTILLGNHDIELALPDVRRALADALRADERRFRLICDGEAYVVGDALIEHGNRYDRYNVVDHDRLRRLRSLHSRRLPVPPEHEFQPPSGSRLVSEVINPIKDRYAFVDLLKPERAAVVPLLLALEPGYAKKICSLLPLELESRKHGLRTRAVPAAVGDISTFARQAGQPPIRTGTFDGDMGGLASTASADIRERARLDAAIVEALGSDAQGFLTETTASLAGAPRRGDISSARDAIDRACGLAVLVCASAEPELERRLAPLRKALRALQDDCTFERSAESASEYAGAAEELSSQNRFNYVVFGHTHLARDVRLSTGARYLNTGTWADVMKFPTDLLVGSDESVRPRLRSFVEDLAAGRIDSYVHFIPTYVRLDVDNEGHVAQAELREFVLSCPI